MEGVIYMLKKLFLRSVIASLVCVGVANAETLGNGSESAGRYFVSAKIGMSMLPKAKFVHSYTINAASNSGSKGSKASAGLLGLSGGYNVNDDFRISLDYMMFLKNRISNGSVTISDSYLDDTNVSYSLAGNAGANYSIHSALLRASYDVVALSDSAKLYLTAGVGLSAIKYSASRSLVKKNLATENQTTTTDKISKSKRGLGYSVGAGMTFKASDTVGLDVGYSFNGFAKVNSKTSGKLLTNVVDYTTQVKLPSYAHEISASLRVTF